MTLNPAAHVPCAQHLSKATNLCMWSDFLRQALTSPTQPLLRDVDLFSDVTPAQRWIKIALPQAFPHIMFGVTQTVVFVLSMATIGAMYGRAQSGTGF